MEENSKNKIIIIIAAVLFIAGIVLVIVNNNSKKATSQDNDEALLTCEKSVTDENGTITNNVRVTQDFDEFVLNVTTKIKFSKLVANSDEDKKLLGDTMTLVVKQFSDSYNIEPKTTVENNIVTMEYKLPFNKEDVSTDSYTISDVKSELEGSGYSCK